MKGSRIFLSSIFLSLGLREALVLQLRGLLPSILDYGSEVLGRNG